MDSRTVKIALNVAAVFFAGGAVGAIAGFVVGRDRGRKDAWLDADVELANQEDRLKRLYKVGEYHAIPGAAALKQFEQTQFEQLVNTSPVDLSLLKEHIEKQGYHTFSDTKVVPTDEQLKAAMAGSLFDTYTNEDESPEITPSMSDAEPYLVTEEIVDHDNEHYNRIELSFYPTDRVVADELERVVEDVETTIGINNLNYFSPENQVLYICNDRLQAYFVVALEVGSYRETVLGEELPVMERRGRKRTPKEE